VPGGKSPSRTTENVALKQLAPIDDLSLDIVQAAINDALVKPHGDLTLEIIRRVDWDRTHTLENISAILPVSRMTAQRYRSGFIRLVAKKAGWL
jgi:response regulator of citrate/malate metabolism